MNIAFLGLTFLCALGAADPGPLPVKESGEAGAILKVSGYTGPDKQPVPRLDLRTAPWNSEERREPDGSFVMHQTKGREHFVRLGGETIDGRLVYSDCVQVRLETGKTLVQELELKPGLPLIGRLDASVPRPVREGRVVALAGLDDRVLADASDGFGEQRVPAWVLATDIERDGTFRFPSLPPGKVELFAFTDRYVTRNPSDTPSDWIRPQAFSVAENAAEVELAMEPFGACEITVLAPEGLPLAGAEVAVRQEIAWRNSTNPPVEDFLFGDITKAIRQDLLAFGGHYFSFGFRTDGNGIARMPTLIARPKIAFNVGYPVSVPEGPYFKSPLLTGKGSFDLSPGVPITTTVQVSDNTVHPAQQGH